MLGGFSPLLLPGINKVMQLHSASMTVRNNQNPGLLLFFFDRLFFLYVDSRRPRPAKPNGGEPRIISPSARVDKVQYASVDQSPRKTFPQKSSPPAHFTVIHILRKETFATRRSPPRRPQAKKHQRGPLSLSLGKKKTTPHCHGHGMR